MQVVGVDVGGTNIEVGLVGDGHEVLERGKENTPSEGPDAVLDTIVDLIEGLDGEPSAVGLGIPGVVHEGRALTVPNLPSWGGEPIDLIEGLTQRTSFPTVLGDDADVGLLGEWLDGAAKGADDVLGIWLGTGVGGGVILEGWPCVGVRGAAGEVGHVIVRQGGQICGCGRRGCVEAYAGRRSMEAAVRAQVAAGRTTCLLDLQEEHGKTSFTSSVWEDALKEGDELATEVFDLGMEALGAGIGSVLNVLDVDLVVIGGGLAEKSARAWPRSWAPTSPSAWRRRPAPGCCAPARTCTSSRPGSATTRGWWAPRPRPARR